MKVVSTNIGETKTISWRGKEVKTGIYKYPVDEPIYLDKEDVKGDHVVDRRVHGGVDKACYLYAAEHYPYWKEKYPNLDWDYGMFGENLTVLGLDERLINIGSVYVLGEALVQVSQPRQPCYKLGVRFGTQTVLKQFIEALIPGVYLRVLTPGVVQTDDILIPHEIHTDGVSIKDMYKLFYDQNSHETLAKKAINDPFVTTNNKKNILNRYGSSIS
ncbi:MOSC domain-containing protein [Aquimarina sp. MMG015]|uniref:MOSC domain-containing protein n=1 Tax=unclassified Aquimarina TaxID=2627091 RepID=UPI000E4696BB|nr:MULTISPECIES: MOSC domain-containing protein [unclassified Aquimarina]AXT55337.1 MOSC domain-containing protein [Aquimarina sp. AD1]MBQ4802304.1 MOSC domain-containing protein [Aquimarina sp. MMG015]RKN13839.1 MOSC domain-containing protein [Aquimarina sp. AD1]